MQVDSYRILPVWELSLANTLPFVEIGLGLLLLIGWKLRVWATVITLIMLGFFIAVVRSYAIGLQINCGVSPIRTTYDQDRVARWSARRSGRIDDHLCVQEKQKPHPWAASQIRSI